MHLWVACDDDGMEWDGALGGGLAVCFFSRSVLRLHAYMGGWVVWASGWLDEMMGCKTIGERKGGKEGRKGTPAVT